MREQFGAQIERASRICFAILLFLSPLGLRMTLEARPTGSVYPSYTDFFLYPADYFVLGCIMCGGLALLVRGRGIRLGPWYLTYPLYGIVLLSWVGVLAGVDATLTAFHSLRLSIFFALYLTLINISMSPVWVGLPLMSGVLVESAVSFGQFVTQHDLGLSIFGELGLDPQQTGISIVRDGTLRVLRAYGLTDHPNLLGGYFAFALILILGYYFSLPPSRMRYVVLIVVALAGSALVLTFSRAAWLALAASLVVFGFFLLWKRDVRTVRFLPAAAAGLVLILALLVPAILNRNLLAQRTGQEDSFSENSGEVRSFDERDALLGSAFRLFVNHSALGVGNAALPEAMYWYDLQFDKRYAYQPVHVVLFEVTTELGIAGGVLWLWLMVAPWIAIAVNRNALFASPWFAAVAAALLVLTVIGFFDYYPWLLPPGRIWQWCVWGLLAGLLSTVPTLSRSRAVGG